jgi:signal transduction histidine kinase
VQLTVYRIMQESLTNTLKHAGTRTRAQLTVSAEGEELHIRVEDTGPAGATPQPAQHLPTGPGAGGHGVAGMRERAALYGGTVTAGPRPGGGWTVDALLHLSSVSPLPPTRTAGAS